MLSDIGHLLSDIDYLLSDVDYILFDYVLYTSYVFPFSFSLFQVHVSSYSYSSFHFHLFISLPLHFSHSLFPYISIYSFLHALISSSLFLSSIYFQSSNLFTVSLSSFINIFVSSFAPLHSRCCKHTIQTHSRQLSCSVLTHIALMGDLEALAADCCLLGGDALLTGGATFRWNLLPVFKVFILPIYIHMAIRYRFAASRTVQRYGK